MVSLFSVKQDAKFGPQSDLIIDSDGNTPPSEEEVTDCCSMSLAALCRSVLCGEAFCGKSAASPPPPGPDDRNLSDRRVQNRFMQRTSFRLSKKRPTTLERLGLRDESGLSHPSAE